MRFMTVNNIKDLKEYLEMDNVNFIIYLYGERCAPCLKLKPLLEEKFKKIDDDDTVFLKINYKASKEINQFLGLKKIPFVVLYKNKERIFDIQSGNYNLVYPPIIEKLDLKEESDFEIGDNF